MPNQKPLKQDKKSFIHFWDRAVTANFKGKVDYVEVPMALSNKQIRLYQFSKDNIKEKPDEMVVAASFQRLVVYKDKKGQIGQRLLTYIPDKKYIREHGYEVSKNSLRQISPNFSGYIEYKNWSGDIVSILRIENGKAVRRYKITKASKEQILNLQPKAVGAKGKVASVDTKTSYTVENCHTEWIPVFDTVCEVNDDGNPKDENLNEVECTYKQVGEYADWVCTTVEVPDPEPCPWGNCDEENPCPSNDCDTPNPCSDCEQPDTDPCDKVGAQSNDPNYKNKASDLKGKTSLKYESGYEEKKNGSYDQLQNSSFDALSAVPTTETKGYIHNHIDDFETGEVNADGNSIIKKPIKMFSPADVNTLMKLVDENRNSGDFSQYYVSMVTSYSHYMLKFTGTANDIKTSFGAKMWEEKYKNYMKDSYNLDKSFLQFLKNEMGINGVELFKIKSNGTIKSIELKSNGKSIEEKDC